MGSWTSRQHAGVEEVDIVSNLAYKYPPRSGNYFGSHFIMGGERFDTPQPEAYLFGENADLNFLGNRPTPFPYPPPQANEPTKTLKSLVNIRKESLRFIRSPESVANKGGGDAPDAIKLTNFNIEFTFDADARCAITIYYFCTEEFTPNGVIYNPRDPTMNSETYHYKRGANQQFAQVSHLFDPSKYTEEELTYNSDREVIPMAIHCVSEEGEEPRQSHTTIAVIDRHVDGSYVLKALKQKLYVDGLCYLLQEIYGIENKNNENTKAGGDEDTEDNGSECVICMCDVRDTLILPCRHLCLCNSCADSLRYQANNCPICRAPFRALLQIRALQKSSSVSQNVVPTEGSCENIPAGYEAVSLIEALNGPCPTRPITVSLPLEAPETPDTDCAVQAATALNRPEDGEAAKAQVQGNHQVQNARGSSGGTCPTPEFRMSVLLALEEENGKEQSTKSPLLVRHCSRDKRPHDTVRLVNEKSVTPTNDQDETPDEDSEAEKLSPLLDPATGACVDTEAQVDELDDDDEDLQLKEELQESVSSVTPINNTGGRTEVDSAHIATGEDSDYYTPEDPATTILSPLHTVDKDMNTITSSNPSSSVESTPGRWMGVGISLPGTPLSNASHRSSGDSYSSSSSTKQLLATTAVATQDKSIQL